MRLTTIAIALTMTAVTGQSALAGEWKIDSTHSAANFRVRHMMVSTVNGTIGGVKGTIEYEGTPSSIKVNADLDPKTINTNEPDRDKHLRNADFFDVEKFPTMSFKSKRVESAGSGKYKLVGDLTMHGVTKEVALNMDEPSPVIKDAKRGLERVGTSASARINRKDFGMTYNSQLDQGGVALGEDIDITIDIEAHREAGDKKAAAN